MVKTLVLAVTVVILGCLGAYFLKSSHSTPSLRIFAYSSFVQPWSAGPQLVAAFEQKFKIPVDLVDAGDSALIIQRLKLDPRPVDVVIGLDQDSFYDSDFPKSWRWVKASNNLLATKFNPHWQRPGFVAVDWAPLTFIVRKSKVLAPQSWDDLLSPKYRKAITLPDPRTSHLGWQFIKWLLNDKGEAGAMAYLKSFRDQIFLAPNSWSAAYGLFQTGQSHLVFSYLTSILYHRWEAKNEDQFTVAHFTSGHPVQVEYAGIPERCQQCHWAQEFLKFIQWPQNQKILAQKNYMLPVYESKEELSIVAQLPQLKIKESLKPLDPETKKKILNFWINLWR